MAIGERSRARVFKIREIIEGSFEDIKTFSFLDVKTQQKIADITADVIRERTRRGFGADRTGKSIRFKGYERKYAEKRRKMGLPVSPPDLTVSGDLLDGIHTERLYSNGSFKLAVHEGDIGKSRGAHEGIWRKDIGLVKRQFLGLTKADKEKILREVRPLIKADYLKYVKNKLKS